MVSNNDEMKIRRELQSGKRTSLQENFTKGAQLGDSSTYARNNTEEYRYTANGNYGRTIRFRKSIANKMKMSTFNESKSGKRGKKLSGGMFIFMIILTQIKDLSDIFFNITGVLFWVTFITGVGIQFIVILYLILNGVKLDSRKFATYITSLIIESIPYLNLLPMATINLLIIRKLENSPLKKKSFLKRARK
jgi:hypothetical protein